MYVTTHTASCIADLAWHFWEGRGKTYLRSTCAATHTASCFADWTPTQPGRCEAPLLSEDRRVLFGFAHLQRRRSNLCWWIVTHTASCFAGPARRCCDDASAGTRHEEQPVALAPAQVRAGVPGRRAAGAPLRQQRQDTRRHGQDERQDDYGVTQQRQVRQNVFFVVATFLSRARRSKHVAKRLICMLPDPILWPLLCSTWFRL